MRLLLCHPGASYSTADVYDGYARAFELQGVEVIPYRLDNRIFNSGKFLHYVWKQEGKPQPPPDARHIMYLAGQGILEMALRHQVDWVLVISAMYLHPDVLILLRRAGVRVAVLFTESPYDDAPQLKIAPYLEACFVNERSSLPAFGAVNPNSFYLAHAIDRTKHRPSRDGDPDMAAHDVVFVGTLFKERIEALEAVNWDGIDLGLYGSFDLLGSRHRLRQYIRGGYTENAEAAALYRRAKIGLNLYRTSMGFGRHAPRIAYAESVNPRALELAACGVFTISDYRAEAFELFGGYVSMFGDASQLEGLIRHWLANDAERKRLAANLPACVSYETFDNRAMHLLATLAQFSARPHLELVAD